MSNKVLDEIESYKLEQEFDKILKALQNGELSWEEAFDFPLEEALKIVENALKELENAEKEC